MKTFLLILAIGAAIYFAIYGPVPIDPLVKQYRETATLKEREAIAREKEAAWRTAYRPTARCNNPQNALAQLECKNDAENQHRYFEDQWNAAIARGWKPTLEKRQ